MIVYTGGGKGKTTAALGLALRAVGRRKRVCMVQFVKGSWHYGELDSAKRLAPEFELVRSGKGFVGIVDDSSPREDHIRAALQTLDIARDRIASGKYDIVILDEINYAIHLDLIGVQDAVSLVEQAPDSVDVVLTGNHARGEIVEMADLVSEMREIKHPYKKGIKAKPGIDF